MAAAAGRPTCRGVWRSPSSAISAGGGRRYSERDVELLREIQRLSQDEGVNLAGIKRIIELSNQVEALQARVAEMAEELSRSKPRRDLAVVPKSTAVVVWTPRKR